MAISKDKLKEVILNNKKDVEQYEIVSRDIELDKFPLQIFVGVRRSGKSFLLYQKMRELLNDGHSWDELLYIDFEDNRLDGFTASDFNLILECHAELYDTRPILFFDEIQNIDGWEKYARTLADKKYSVFITGSNAKMLSQEIMAPLGGRYLPAEVFPYGFKEFLKSNGTAYDTKSLLSTEKKVQFLKAFNEYFVWGGLPESANLPVKRHYLSSVFQKIYIGDIALRNNISNVRLLQLMIRKMAESVMQPISYNRISKVLSSVGGKISVPTIANYIAHAEDAWLLLRLRNINAPLTEKEGICKYYFIDNGILSLLLMNAETILLENIVALSLFRKYGHDMENERVFFFNGNVEVDFYVPEDELAVQASYRLDSTTTQYREAEALRKFAKTHTCKRRVIVTYDEERSIADEYGTIDVIPCWKWLLEIEK